MMLVMMVMMRTRSLINDAKTRQEGGGGGSIVEQCPTFLSGFATSVLIQANIEVLIIGDQENCIKKNTNIRRFSGSSSVPKERTGNCAF